MLMATILTSLQDFKVANLKRKREKIYLISCDAVQILQSQKLVLCNKRGVSFILHMYRQSRESSTNVNERALTWFWIMGGVWASL